MKNETLEVLRNRSSLRVFDQVPLTTQEEQAIIEGAMLAPTAGNQMLYSMIVIRDQEKKKKLSKLCDYQLFIASAPFVVVFVADHHRWYDYFRMHDVPEFCDKQKIEFRKPSESDLLLAIEDAMVAAQNSVICAQSIGIGSCYIGDILENYECVKELLQLPDETFPIAMLVYGHCKEGHKSVHTERFNSNYIVFEDTYKQLQEDDYNQMFKKRETAFAPQNKYAAQNFAQQFYARKTGANFSKEMERSVNIAIKDWCKK